MALMFSGGSAQKHIRVRRLPPLGALCQTFHRWPRPLSIETTPPPSQLSALSGRGCVLSSCFTCQVFVSLSGTSLPAQSESHLLLPDLCVQTWRRRSPTRRSGSRSASGASRGSETSASSSEVLTDTFISHWWRTGTWRLPGTTTSPWPTPSGTTWWAAGSAPSSTTTRRTRR